MQETVEQVNTEIIPNMDERLTKMEEKLAGQVVLLGQLAKLVDVLCQRANVSIDAVLSKEE